MPLSRFETLAQRLVEGSFSRLFGGQLEPLEVATRLARALEDSQADGRAADYFYVRLHPHDYDSVCRQNPNLADELAGYVTRLARQASLSLPVRPRVELSADPAVSRHRVQVQAEYGRQPADPTTRVHRRVAAEEEALKALQLLDAFLIVEGRQHVPLDRPLITLGRRTDNDIVLDSPAVSRRHAQIRWRYGRFVLYDLSSRGRTAVNGQPVSETILRPGDVIALSGVPLIYGEGREGRPGQSSPAGEKDGQTLLMPKEP